MARIVSDPSVAGGQPRVEGTEITVARIVRLMFEYRDPKAVYAALPELPSGAIEVALDYYNRHHDAVDRAAAAAARVFDGEPSQRAACTFCEQPLTLKGAPPGAGGGPICGACAALGPRALASMARRRAEGLKARARTFEQIAAAMDDMDPDRFGRGRGRN